MYPHGRSGDTHWEREIEEEEKKKEPTLQVI